MYIFLFKPSIMLGLNKLRGNMIHLLGSFFGYLFKACYGVIGNYGLAIITFTLVAKVIQIPLSVLLQFNSIKMVKMYPEMNMVKAKFYGSKDLISEENYKLYKKHNYHPLYDLIPVVVQLVILMGVVEGLRSFNITDTCFLGVDLATIPIEKQGITFLIPLLAAISAWLMCFTQNISNVLQAEQSKMNKIVTMSISVGLSLYLGLFVQAGVGLYWIAGNILAIIQMYILNVCINPKNYIDYEALSKSKEELEKVQKTISTQKKSHTKEELARSREDAKRFDRYGTKQLVFYSEGKGFYKYFKDVIEYILNKTDITIHYITSDIEDEIFKMTSDYFQTYYISENKLISTMMKMDSDMVVMTMPDLQKFHIKKSIIRQDIEYVYIDHGIGSVNLMLRKHALDAFDTVFASNDISYNELKAQEDKYGLKPRNIVKYGFCLIDNMIEAYASTEKTKSEKPIILIAPSWQPDNILDSCIYELLDVLLNGQYSVIVRPHPQYVRHCMDSINKIVEKYSECSDFEMQTDFSSNSTVFNADILVTDWSGIAYEYTLTTLKPVLFINTPMKIMNVDYEEIGVVPFDIEVRDKMGISVDLKDAGKVSNAIDRLRNDNDFSVESMLALRQKYLYNVGKSAEVGAKYIINRLIEISNR